MWLCQALVSAWGSFTVVPGLSSCGTWSNHWTTREVPPKLINTSFAAEINKAIKAQEKTLMKLTCPQARDQETGKIGLEKSINKRKFKV